MPGSAKASPPTSPPSPPSTIRAATPSAPPCAAPVPTIFSMEKRTPGIAVVHDNLPEIQNGRAPSGIVYQKGGWTLHMLRGVIGNATFWAGIREYYRRYRDANAGTEDLRRVMEETSGADLAWFFQQWLHRPGSPAVSGGWTYDAAAGKSSSTSRRPSPATLTACRWTSLLPYPARPRHSTAWT